MTTNEIINTLAICNLTEKYSVEEAQACFDFCLAATKNDEAKAKNHFLEICAQRAYELEVEASNPASPVLFS